MADELKFEDALEQLEKLVSELEGGELDLDQALSRFEKGVALSKQLNESLESATRKVEKLVLDKNGVAQVSPLDGEEGEALETPKKGKPKAKKAPVSQDTLFE